MLTPLTAWTQRHHTGRGYVITKYTETNHKRMNVAKTSFAKSQDQPKSRTQSADSTPDSGVLSQDSGDSSEAQDKFKEVIMNLKALNGEDAEEVSQPSPAAEPKVAGKAANGVVAPKAPLPASAEKSSAAASKVSSVFERLSAAAAGASAPVRDGKKSPPAGQKHGAKASSSPHDPDQEVSKKHTDTAWEKGPSPDTGNPSRNVLQELMSALPSEGGSHFDKVLGHSDLEGKGAPLARTDKVPKSQKGNLFEKFTKMDTGGKYSHDKGTGKSDNSEGASVTSGAVPAQSDKKDDSVKDTANKVCSDKQSAATEKVSSASVLKGLAKVAVKTESGAASVTKDPVEKESASEAVGQTCDKGKSGPHHRDKDEKSDDDALRDKSVKSKELPSGGDGETSQKDATKKSADSPSPVSRSDSSEGDKNPGEGDVAEENPSGSAMDTERDSRAASPASHDDSSTDSRKRVAEETTSSEDQSSAPKRSRLGDVIGKLARTIGVKPETVTPIEEPMQEDESEAEESMDSDSAEAKSEGSGPLEDDDDAAVSPPQSLSSIVISQEELEELVRASVKECLAEQRVKEMGEMTTKLEEALANCDRYRKECKELHRQVLDLTVIQQRLERRKAATAALRSISTKNVGVQVDSSLQGVTSPKTQKMTLVIPGTSGGTPGVIGNPTMSVVPIQPLQTNPVHRPTAIVTTTLTRPMGQPVRPIAAAPLVTFATQVMRQTPAVTAVHNNVTVKSLLDAKNSALPTASTGDRWVINNTGASTMIAPKTVGTATKIATSAPPSKQGVIDLTDDDEGSRVPQTTTAPRTIHLASVSSVRPTIVTQGGILRPLTSIQSGGPPILVSPTATITTGSVPRPNILQPLQVVTLTSANTTIRPGSLLTVVSQPPVKTSVAPLPAPSVRPSIRSSAPHTLLATPVSRPTVTTVPILVSRPAPPRVFPPLTSTKTISLGHPAPLPPTPAVDIAVGSHSAPPPQPSLKISRVSQGIVLSWTMTLTDGHAQIKSYQLYAYQEGTAAPSTSLWKKVGDVNALPLPMACTLTQFQEGNKYHFAVRAQDVYERLGDFSEPSAIHLTPR